MVYRIFLNILLVWLWSRFFFNFVILINLYVNFFLECCLWFDGCFMKFVMRNEIYYYWSFENVFFFFYLKIKWEVVLINIFKIRYFFYEIMVEFKLGIYLDISSCLKIEKELMIVKVLWSVIFLFKVLLIVLWFNIYCYKIGRKLFKIWCF